MPSVEIPLTQGQTAVIDECDLPLVQGLRWHAALIRGHWYAAHQVRERRGRQVCVRKLYLHRLIMESIQAPERRAVNGNALDCRRANFGVMT